MKNSKVVYVEKWICRKCDRNSKCTECEYYGKLLDQDVENELKKKHG